jgi:glycosyltransferase involved in cell wall biosynthesis
MSVEEKELLFSVCIPVRNDLKNLRRCLSALARQNLSGCEILVCDDGSSPALSEADLRDTGAQVTLIRQKGQGPAAARNHIARLARGKYLFFMDADTVASHDLIVKTADVISENPGIPVFYGSYDDDPDSRTLVSAYRNLLHHYTHHQSAKNMEHISTFWCGCGVILRELYLRFGGLSVGYGKPSIEDIELGTRLAAAGTPIRIFPQIQVKHLKKWTVKNWLYTDLFLRGIPWVRLMRASKSWSNQLNFSWSQRVASLAAVGVVMSVPLTLWQPLFAVAGVGCLATFITLNRHLLDLIRKKRGIAGAIAVIPLHLAYALICVLSVAAAMLYPPLKLPPPQELQPLFER